MYPGNHKLSGWAGASTSQGGLQDRAALQLAMRSHERKAAAGEKIR